MQNNEMRRFFERLHDDLSDRMTRLESGVKADIGTLSNKFDGMQQKCAGCAREIGEISAQVRETAENIAEHKAEHSKPLDDHLAAHDEPLRGHLANHRFHATLAGTIGGIIVAIIAFLWDIWKGAK